MKMQTVVKVNKMTGRKTVSVKSRVNWKRVIALTILIAVAAAIFAGVAMANMVNPVSDAAVGYVPNNPEPAATPEPIYPLGDKETTEQFIEMLEDAE